MKNAEASIPNTFWTSAQFSMTFSLSTATFVCPPPPRIYHTNWKEILTVNHTQVVQWKSTSCESGIGVQRQGQNLYIYRSQEIWPKELFKGFILTAVHKEAIKSQSLPSKGRGAGRKSRQKSALWLLVWGGSVTNFSQIFQPFSHTFLIFKKYPKVAWLGFYDSQLCELWLSMDSRAHPLPVLLSPIFNFLISNP